MTSLEFELTKVRHIASLLLLACSALAPYASADEQSVIEISDTAGPQCDVKHLQVCHDFGRTAEKQQDIATAEKNYKFACEKGLAKSCNNMALMFAQNHLEQKAINAFRSACELNHKTACSSGETFSRAAHRNDDAEWFAQHNPAAKGSVHNPTQLVDKSKSKKIEDLTDNEVRALCKKQDASICADLARIQEDRGELNLAIELYYSACDKKAVFGCLQASDVYRRLENLEGARQALQKACQVTTPESCNQIRMNACAQGIGWQCNIPSGPAASAH